MACAAAGLVAVAAVLADADSAGDRLARFNAHVQALPNLDDRTRQLVADALAEGTADDAENLLIESLVLLNADFRAGLDAFDEEDYPAAVEALARAAESEDPWLAQNARFYLVKAQVERGALVDAEQRIDAILDEAEAFRAHAFGEVELWYMLGYCQLQNLKRDHARRTLESFLADFPDAPDRLVVTARQMLAELDRWLPEGIGEIADLMMFSEKRLAVGDASDAVQQKQQRAVELLDKLIEQAEQAEQNTSASSSSSPSPRQQQRSPQPQGADQPAQDSRARGGASDEPKRPGRRVNPGDAWGAMPAAEREKVLQVLRDRFPGRYRALVEQYYESLAQEP